MQEGVGDFARGALRASLVVASAPARRSGCPRWRPAAHRNTRAADGAAGCMAGMTPISSRPGATSGAIVERGARSTSTMGRAALSKACSAAGSSSACSRDRVETIGAALRKHDGERLVRPSLAIAQRQRRRGLARIAHQVIAADAFDGEVRLPTCSKSRPPRQRLVGHRARRDAGFCSSVSCGPQAGTRAAPRGSAGHRRRVFRGARRAQREARHRRVRPIVGQRVDQRVTRPALRAVDERIAISAVARIVEFAPAVLAHEVVRPARKRSPPMRLRYRRITKPRRPRRAVSIRASRCAAARAVVHARPDRPRKIRTRALAPSAMTSTSPERLLH